MFTVDIGGYLCTLYGNHLRVRSAERSSKKLKSKSTTDLWLHTQLFYWHTYDVVNHLIIIKLRCEFMFLTQQHKDITHFYVLLSFHNAHFGQGALYSQSGPYVKTKTLLTEGQLHQELIFKCIPYKQLHEGTWLIPMV